MKLINTTLTLMATSIIASCGTNTTDPNQLTMVVGTYTYDTSHGIYAFRFNQDNAQCQILDSAKVSNPSYVAITANGKHLYAVTEEGDQSMVNAFHFDSSTGSMKLINSVSADADPCHITLINDSCLSVANYSGGSVQIFKTLPSGALCEGAQRITFNCPVGPDTLRQTSPHMHFTIVSPNGKLLYANDLGTDCVHAIDLSQGNKPLESTKVAPGYGPRHSVFSADGKHLYLLNELSGTIVVFDHDSNTGSLTQTQDIVADSVNAKGSADITISPDGKFLYASHRLKNDGVSCYAIDADGKLTRIGFTATGLHPRNFIITPNGKYMLVACRDSNSIEVYERNLQTGLLTATGINIAVPRPVCIKFAK
ncbi:MAG: lactonase family protein [Muribaculaceae bacterium]